MTKTKWIALALPALIVLSACSKPAPPPGSGPPAPQTDKAADSAADRAVSVPQLAYDDTYGFTAPGAGPDALLKADQTACDAAGVAQCQTVSLTDNGDAAAGYSEKTLELRVTPGWLKAWQGGLETRLAQMHARIRQQTVSSEDLSLQVLDTEAHLKNKEALRDRLRDIVRTHEGRLSDIVDVETQLSQVQADIDATQSSLATMRKRIATVHLVLAYRSDMAPAADVFAPVTGAVRSSLGVAMQVTAALIGLLAGAVPLAIVGLPLAWYLRRGARRRKPPAPDITA